MLQAKTFKNKWVGGDINHPKYLKADKQFNQWMAERFIAGKSDDDIVSITALEDGDRYPTIVVIYAEEPTPAFLKYIEEQKHARGT